VKDGEGGKEGEGRKEGEVMKKDWWRKKGEGM
jgi:hypothetical protein